MLDIFILILILFAGIALIIKGGDYVVAVCGKLSDLTGINEALIGATLTSFATTLPEFIIAILGMSQHASELVLGNTFGTILVNICLVLGISLASMKLLRINKKTLNKLLFMVVLVLIISILSIFKILNYFTGIILVIVFFVYFIKSCIDIKSDLIKNKKGNEDKVVKKIKVSLSEKISEFLKFIVGVLLIFAGAQIIINAIENLSSLLNINSSIFGLIVTAVGTSLPELITSITSIKKKRLNLALGNVIGANIINLTLILGASAVINGFTSLTLSFVEVLTVIPILLISTLMLAIPMLKNKRTYKFQGITLISLYAIYCIIIILLI